MGKTALFCYFLFFGVSLFLGDGKQSVVEAFWTVGVFALLFSVTKKKTVSRPLPSSVAAAWGFISAYHLLVLPFSDSAGSSLSALTRLGQGFLVFYLFFSYATHADSRFFRTILLVLLATSAIFSIFSDLFPSLVELFPPMNLLVKTHGHNHVVDLVVLGFPLSFFLAFKTPSARTLGILTSLVVSALFSGSRGVWALLFVWTAGFVLFVTHTKKTTRLVGGVVAALFLLFYVFFAVSPALQVGSRWFGGTRLTGGKSWLVLDARLRYWDQAIRSFWERPWFGSGPGTFFLESKRLERDPGEFSWFTHSLPLEFLSESGLVGLGLWLLLATSLARRIRRPASSASHYLAWGAVLSLVYSLYEYNLSFLSVWLLFWAIIGLSLAENHRARAESDRGAPALVSAWLVFLGLFYLSSTFGILGAALGGALGQKLAPQSVDLTLVALSRAKKTRTPLSQWDLDVIRFFHRRDPEILFSLGEAIETVSSDSAKQYYASSLEHDPLNSVYFKKLSQHYLAHGMYADFGNLLRSESALFRSGASLRVDLSSPKFFSAYSRLQYARLEKEPFDERYFPKLFYGLGLDFLETDPALSRDLWELASDLEPRMGYLFTERMSLERYVFHDEGKARTIFDACRTNRQARLHCRNLLPAFKNLQAPGGMKDAILGRESE